jgi:hypothetical protein
MISEEKEFDFFKKQLNGNGTIVFARIKEGLYMGFRYRKSINLGGGFRVNLSKSGIGYSFGRKGFRVSKTARGTTRRTASIPGTGVSYVKETGKKSRNAQNRGAASPQSEPVMEDSNSYDTQSITNNAATEMVSEGLEDMLGAASRALKFNKIAALGFLVTLVFGFAFPLLLILTAIFAALMIYIRKKGTILLDYRIDADEQSDIDKRMNPMIKIAKCDKVWRILQTSKVIDKKYSSGASSTVNRTPCRVTTKPPFPFKTNLPVASFKTGKETLLFLPDKLFILQGSKIGALSYCDISASFHTTRFVESEAVPKDAQIVDETWKYVNKSGGPDKRFSDNKKLPICLYGKLELTSNSGLNTVILFSNPNLQ